MSTSRHTHTHTWKHTWTVKAEVIITVTALSFHPTRLLFDFNNSSSHYPAFDIHSLLFDVTGWVSTNWGWIIPRRFTSAFPPLCRRLCSTDSGFIPPVVFEGIISLDWKRPLLSCQTHCSRCTLGFRRSRADTFINMTPCFVLLASFWLAMAFELEAGKLIGLRLMHGNRGLWEKAGWPEATHDRQIMTV